MRVLYLSLGIVAADQMSKLAVKGFSIPFLGIHYQGMDYAQSVHVLGNWFNITFIENPNMAFSLEVAGKLFLAVFALIASIVLLIYLYKNQDKPLLLRVALALILAGAVGNLIDRTLYGVLYGTAPLFEGNVVDFIDLNLFTVNFGGTAFRFWPIFNIADSAVSVGVVLLIFASRGKKEVPAESPLPEPADTAELPAEEPERAPEATG